MTTRDTPWPVGAPCWVDLAVEDLHAARRRYAHLFGWDTDPGEEADYVVALKNGRAAAGLMLKPDEGMPSAWLTHLATDDAAATAQAVADAGGQVLRGPEGAGRGMGIFAVCADPEGAVFALWQAQESIGVGVVDEPGTFVWSTLLTRDLAAAKTFYGTVFGYTFEARSDDLVTFSTADGTLAGGFHTADQLPPDIPAHWLVHFGVADRDATIGLAELEDDTEVLMSFDTPYGAEASIRGPEGEVFNVIGVDES